MKAAEEAMLDSGFISEEGSTSLKFEDLDEIVLL